MLKVSSWNVLHGVISCQRVIKNITGFFTDMHMDESVSSNGGTSSTHIVLTGGEPIYSACIWRSFWCWTYRLQDLDEKVESL